MTAGRDVDTKKATTKKERAQEVSPAHSSGIGGIRHRMSMLQNGDQRESVVRPVVKAKVTDKIIEVLRQEIATGIWAKGSKLPTERILAERFGVSQPTIRETVRALDAMGLVEVHHGSGAYVGANGAYVIGSALQTLLQIERVGVLEILDVRAILGHESARRAATLSTATDRKDMRLRLEALRQVGEADSVDEVIGRIAQFQTAVSAAAHNPFLHALETFLITLSLHLQSKVIKSRGLRYWRTRSLGFNNDRQAIHDAIEERVPEKAAAAMEVYLQHQRKTFMGDPATKNMRLSDPGAAVAVAEMVFKLKSQL